MNPNSTQNSNNNLNQTKEGVNNSPFVTPTPIGFSTPQSSGIQSPQTVNNNQVQGVQAGQTVSTQTPVSPTPMPASGTPNVASVMPAQGVPVTPTPMNSDITKEDPNAKLVDVNVPPSANMTQEAPEVINTVKSKGSNFAMFIIIGILVFLAVNIDKASQMYENYMKTGSLTSTTVTPDNTSDGYIKIDDTVSSMKVSEIKFYKFHKNNSDLSIDFNYEAFATYDDSESLNLYIELYNSEKELLYKELFKTDSKIEMHTVSSYSMKLDSDVHTDAFYALVKTYSDEELSSTSTLTCKYTDNNYEYENKYNFTNNSLMSYEVTKKSLNEDDTALEKEYNDLNGKVTATYSNKILKYSVDLNKESDFSPLYPKGLTPVIVKNRDTLKEWICE